MFYEEKMIDGVLHWRGTPTGDWQPVSPRELAEKIDILRTRLAESEARAEVGARDAARYRVLRSFGKKMKLYIYDDPADAYPGDWIYNPHPKVVDELADAAIQTQEAERG